MRIESSDGQESINLPKSIDKTEYVKAWTINNPYNLTLSMELGDSIKESEELSDIINDQATKLGRLVSPSQYVVRDGGSQCTLAAVETPEGKKLAVGLSVGISGEGHDTKQTTGIYYTELPE